MNYLYTNSIVKQRGEVDGKRFFPILEYGINYKDALTKIEQAGFTNVTAEVAEKRSGVEKWVQKMEKYAGEIKNGSVIELSINGNVEYLGTFDSHEGKIEMMGTYIEIDAKIVVRYYKN